jgi:acetylornithine/succinyldiaminopimelate/putrescine aminotransferase
MTELTVEKAAVAEDEVGLIAPTYPLPRLELAKGRGARVWDKDGVERLDFVSGIAVNAFGHAPRGSCARSRTRRRSSATSRTSTPIAPRSSWRRR